MFCPVDVAQICRWYNVASSAVYRWRGEFISAGTAAMEQGKSTIEQSLMKEINELNGIIGKLTTANETLKNSSYEERWEAMNDLALKGFPNQDPHTSQ